MNKKRKKKRQQQCLRKQHMDELKTGKQRRRSYDANETKCSMEETVFLVYPIN